MADVLLAPYVSETIDAANELRALGDDIASYFLKHLARVARRPAAQIPLYGHYTRPSATIPVFKAEHTGCFIVFVVSRESDGGFAVTLIFAGRMADYPAPPGKLPGWHRSSAPIVEPRLKDFYHV